MTTDNRTNEQIVLGILSPDATKNRPMAMNYTNRVIEALSAAGLLSEGAPSEEQVEAAAKAIEKIPHIVWNSPTRQDAKTLARAALMAAACVTPKQPSNVTGATIATAGPGQCRVTFNVDGMSEEHLPGCGHEPIVQRSSTVDEGKIAEVIAKANYDWSQQRLEFWRRPENVEPPGDLDKFTARAVVEAIGGETPSTKY